MLMHTRFHPANVKCYAEFDVEVFSFEQGIPKDKEVTKDNDKTRELKACGAVPYKNDWTHLLMTNIDAK